MKQLSECRVLLVDDAKANLDILVEGLKADHKLSIALNGEMALGTWQAIYLIEHRARAHRREVVLQFIGAIE